MNHKIKYKHRSIGGSNNDNSDNLIIELYDAIESGNFNLVKELIDKGVNPNGFLTTDMDSPLYNACSINTDDGHKIVKLLLEKGANPTIYNKSTKDTPLHVACKNKNDKAINLLLNGPNIAERNNYIEKYNIYSKLLNVCNIHGQLALYIVCNNNDIKSTKIILESFNNIDVMFYTCKEGDKSLLALANDGSFSYEINNLIIKYKEKQNSNRSNSNNSNNNNIQENIFTGANNAIIREEQAKRDPIINLGKNIKINKNTIHQLKKIQQKCFDPIMYNNIDISSDVAVFYIMGEKDKITHIGCYDEDTLENYKNNNDVLYYKCKPTIPITATMIIKNSVEPVGYRKLNFAFDIYVNSKQLQNVTIGKTYILRKTNIVLGQIASYHVIMGGTAVSAEHCGTNYKDKVYDIREATIVEHRRIYKKKYKTRRTYRGIQKTKKKYS